MRVRARYFARLRELLGRDGEERDVPPGTTVGELLQLIGGERAASALAPSIACAVNMEYASRERVLAEGDEVAFLPPVSGG